MGIMGPVIGPRKADVWERCGKRLRKIGDPSLVDKQQALLLRRPEVGLLRRVLASSLCLRYLRTWTSAQKCAHGIQATELSLAALPGASY